MAKRRRSVRPEIWFELLIVALLCAAGSVASAQTVSGRVINGISGVPVPRALVRLNQRAVLTDSVGHFEFQQVTEQNAYLVVSKPGYYASLDDAGGGFTPVAAELSGTPTTLPLYPETIITGTVSTRAGEPLQRVQLSLSRMSYNDSGPRLIQTGFTSTNTRGEFRFAAQPGAYRVSLNYSPAGRDRSEAVLPTQFPEPTSTSASSTFRMVSSEVRHLDLHPKTSTVYPVRLQADGNSEQRLSQITVRTAAGLEFTVAARNDRSSGSEARAMHIDLPAGSYHLHTLSAGSQAAEAEASITVTGQATDGVVLHFQAVPSLPIQVQVDTSVADTSTNLNGTASAATPNPSDFSPSLRPLDRDESSNSGVHIDTRPDKTLVLTAPAGRYRLLLVDRGHWYIKSAFYGTTDLLTHDLVIGPGAGGEAIRLLVSADTGKLAGTARVNGTPALAWVYLIANGPSAAPVTTLHTQRDGTFVQNYMPPGSYTVLALPQRASVDLTNPEIRAGLGGRAPTVQVVEGAEATVDLDVAPDLTARQGQAP